MLLLLFEARLDVSRVGNVLEHVEDEKIEKLAGHGVVGGELRRRIVEPVEQRFNQLYVDLVEVGVDEQRVWYEVHA